MTNEPSFAVKKGETTAQSLARYFENQGIKRQDIGFRELRTFYSTMKRSAHTATKAIDLEIDCPEDGSFTADPISAVIVETRKHPMLEFVIGQFARELNIGIQIFHSPSNKEFIVNSDIGMLMDCGQVHLNNIGKDKFSPQDYNALLLNKSFWRAVQGRNKIMIFQTDALLCSNSDYELKDFMGFDYIGSKWTRQRPVGIVMDGGNGGLSLRDWKLTTECLDRFPANHWPGGEDGYFAFHFDLIGGKVGREQDCEKFSTQIEFNQKSFGAHQIQNLDKASLNQFLQYCPEAQAHLRVIGM